MCRPLSIGIRTLTVIALLIIVPAAYSESNPTAISLSSEDGYASHKASIDAFFAKSPIQSIAGQPYRSRPVRIDYKKFIHPQAKAAIVLVHGFSENFYKYRETIFDLYNQGYTVFAYNQRGHGYSRLIEDQAPVHVDDFQNYVDDLHELVLQKVKPLNIPVVILAHSMGGAVGSLYAETYPDDLDALVLSAPMLGMKTDGFPLWAARSLSFLGAHLGLSESFAPGQTPPQNNWSFEEANTQSKVRWEDYRDFSYHPDWQDLRRGGATYGWVNAALSATNRLMQAEQIAKISKPVLLFQAGIDTYVPSKEQDQFCQMANNCTLHRYDQAKHEIYREIDSLRQDFFAKVFQFINSLPTRSAPRLPQHQGLAKE